MDPIVDLLTGMNVLTISGVVAIIFGFIQVIKGPWMKFDPEKDWLPLATFFIGGAFGALWGWINTFLDGDPVQVTYFTWIAIGAIAGLASNGVYKIVENLLPGLNWSRE